jgi:hypothetical protein
VPSAHDWQYLVAQLAPEIAKDPRVRPTIRVGAIGHRIIQLSARDRVIEAVQKILSQIRDAATSVRTDPSVSKQFREDLDLVILSPLAQGADTLIAHAALPQGYRLGVILPSSPTEYETTFDPTASPEAVLQFRALLERAELPSGYGVLALDGGMGTQSQRDESFIHCAKAVVRWSDVIIAVSSAERRDSQTAVSVLEAIDMGLPVVVIDPDLDGKITIYLDHEKSSSESFESIRDAIISILRPSGRTFLHKHFLPGRSSSNIDSYRLEHVEYDSALPCDFNYQGPYRVQTVAPSWVKQLSGLNLLLEQGITWLLGRAKNNVADLGIRDLRFQNAMVAPIVAMFLRYHRADVIANAYAELYRSIQILVVTLGIATVAFAGISATTSYWPALLAGLELVSFSLALTLVWIAHQQAWLERWLDCRLIAEILRYSKFLMLTGRASPFMELRKPCTGEDAERAWTRDYSQHVLRAHCLDVPGRDRTPHPDAVREVKQYVINQCLEDQIRYHEHTAVQREKLARILKSLSVFLSFSTVVVIATKFILKTGMWLGMIAGLHATSGAVELTAVILPAVTAAIFALRAYGEHDVVARRCATMVADLQDERMSVQQARNLEELGERTLGVVRLLLWDVDGWLDLFADKYLD